MNSQTMKHSNKILIIILHLVITLSLIRIVIAATAINLASAEDFAILAGSTITNTGDSVITGDLGLDPGTSVTGFPPGILNGVEHVADAEAIQAKVDLVTAYNNATSQTPTTVITELGGSTKTAGVYNSTAGTFGLTGTLTLDAEGDPDAVFIFRTNSTLTTAGASNVLLLNGAQACNVFWQVGSSATLGANSTFKGNILAMTSVTLGNSANVEGRILAREAAVTLDTNIITKAECLIPPDPDPPDDPPAVPPLINVMKVPTPLVLPDGSGEVTYEYTVTNPGTVPMSNIIIGDNKCSTVDFVSGDTDNDELLDLSETWIYSCTTTLTETTTNTATVTGEANGLTATDTANATVVVGIALTPPLIHMVKLPSVFLTTAGTSVTYTYTVTNPGTAALSNVSVVDDKCDAMSAPTGDTNSDELLDVSETWVYTCTMILNVSTVNIGTAQGSANGLTIIDYSPATVAVTQSELPDTAWNGDPQGILLNFILLTILCLLSGTFLYKSIKKL